MQYKSFTLQNGATGTGEGTAADVPYYTEHMFYIKTTGVPCVSTVEIQAVSPNGDWHTLQTISVVAASQTTVRIEGYYTRMRANITSHASGTVTATLDCRG